jgi:hypothetical protein
VGWWGVRPGRDESTQPNHRAGNGRRIASLTLSLASDRLIKSFVACGVTFCCGLVRRRALLNPDGGLT